METNTASPNWRTELLPVAIDARDSDRMADGVRLLCTEGNMTLLAAIVALTPVRAPQVGDILECGWGYEQTRYDFYKVVKVTKASIKIRKIRKIAVSRGQQGTATVVPQDGDDAFPEGELLTRRYRPDGLTQYSCKISDYSWANLWDGEPCRESGDY